MLRTNAVCKTVAWPYYRKQSDILWSTNGSSATSVIVSAIEATMYSITDRLEVQQLLQQNQQYISATVSKNVLNRISINRDLIAVNRSEDE